MEAKKNPLSMQIDPALFEAATEDEKRQADVMSESTTFFKDGMRKLMKNPLAVGSIIVLLFIIITISIAPMVVPYTYSDIIKVNGRRDRTNKNLSAFEYSEMEQKYIDEGGKVFPHIMGTDSLGRDYFIRVVYGARISLIVGLFASILVLIIGVIYGSIAGYTGGRTDLIMMRIVDIIYSLPDMLIIILLSTVLQPILENTSNPVVNALGTNMICIHRRKARPHHPQAYHSQLYFRHHHNDSFADPFRDLYRELSVIHRYGRQRTHAFPGISCELRP